MITSFHLTLPDWLKIHPVISIEHLEKKESDPYQRKLPGPGPIRQDEHDKYIIDKIIRKEMRSKVGQRGRHPWYLVRYHGYDEEEWQDGSILRQDVPQLVRKFDQSQRDMRRE